MNKKVLKVAFVAAIALVSGINVFNAQKSETLSEVAMANVEALAGLDDGNWYCVGDLWLCYFDEEGVIWGEYHKIEEEVPED